MLYIYVLAHKPHLKRDNKEATARTMVLQLKKEKSGNTSVDRLFFFFFRGLMAHRFWVRYCHQLEH